MKKLLASALALLAVAPLAACQPSESQPSAPTAPAVGLPNPFVSYGSVGEARAAFGAPFAVPAILPAGFRPMDIAVAATGPMPLAQILYEHGGRQILYRVVRGMGDGDRNTRITTVSGDYNTYPEAGTLDAGGLTVLTRGQDGLIFVAYWERDGFTYCLTARSGLRPEEVRAMIESVR